MEYLNGHQKYERSKLKLSNLLNKKHALKFEIFKLILMLVEKESYTVPHFKAPVYAKMEL